eukprot:3749448-Amphidinium_carterae.1
MPLKQRFVHGTSTAIGGIESGSQWIRASAAIRLKYPQSPSIEPKTVTFTENSMQRVDSATGTDPGDCYTPILAFLPELPSFL